MDLITADILVVGGGTGGSAAAIQAARRGATQGISVVLVSEHPWLGGMLTSAGVSAPDGNELAAFQTGLWGAFLQALRQRQPGGLDNGWVSFFTYDPAVGAQIFADWVAALPNLNWIAGQKPREVLRQGDRVTGVQFDDLTVKATITLDGTELGDLLALGNVPYRWGWETRDLWNEPSAPVSLTDPSDSLYAITQQYPVQSPTWVVVMQDYGAAFAPEIAAPPQQSPDACFEGAWANYGDAETPAGEAFLNYGRLPGDRFMINWPHQGNDYGVGLSRLVDSEAARSQYEQAAQWHSQSFARYIQTHLGQRYGLAEGTFPQIAGSSTNSAFALMPYYRESRRLIGLTTVCEGSILPVNGAQAAALPMTAAGHTSAIALGNYPNDHHYPGFDMPLAPKAISWGGRQTGTPFTIPYGALVPHAIDGLLTCEKNISVSHIANGATRLQPVVLGIGQAAGMAAALCIEQTCEPRDLADGKKLRSLQTALITEPDAPSALIPLFNSSPTHLHWQTLQQHYLTHPHRYPLTAHHPNAASFHSAPNPSLSPSIHKISAPNVFSGHFFTTDKNQYKLHQNTVHNLPKCITLVADKSEITETFLKLKNNQSIEVLGTWNAAGEWLLCQQIFKS